MSNKTKNFKQLVKGNSINNIITALNMAPKIKEELMREYKVNSIEELAFKLK